MKGFKILKWFLGLLSFSISLSAVAQEVSVKSLLQEMTNAESETYWPVPSFNLKQASSYDRRSVSPDLPGWFANGDANQFIRQEEKDGHAEYVMMDAEGPGAIVRFWLTTVVKPGILRFYFDNSEKPTLSIPAFDLMKVVYPWEKPC